MNAPRDLKILAWPATSPANRYPATLYAHLPHAEVDDFLPGWRAIPKAIRRHYDIFHIHWLERAFWRTGKMATLRAVIVTIIVTAIVKMRRGRLVWTAHDPVPHEMQSNAALEKGSLGLLWKFYATTLRAMIDGVILLSVTHRELLLTNHPHLKAIPFTVIPHPHYKGVYPNNLSRSAARDQLLLGGEDRVLLLLGSLRPYKNAEGLIAAFRQISSPSLRLVIAGQPDGIDYQTKLENLADGDSRIRLHFGFVADDALQVFLNAADSMVIPFRRATNSGSVALALSFGKPVAVPKIPIFEELCEIVGDKWMYLFTNMLDGNELERIVRWMAIPRPSEPPLDTLEWDHIAIQTARFFSLVRQG